VAVWQQGIFARAMRWRTYETFRPYQTCLSVTSLRKWRADGKSPEDPETPTGGFLESGKSVEAARRRARPTSRQPGVEVGEPAQPRRLYRRKVTRRDCGAPESLKRRNLPAHCTERRAGYFTVKRLLSIHASHGHARSGNFIRSVSSVGKTKLGVTPL
jgi:hypothetical protein